MAKKKKVIKMDGSVQDFDKEKIVQSIIKAGASEKVARKIADKIEKKIADREEITTREIREMVLKELEKSDPTARDSWIFYDRLVKGRITFERGKFVVIEKGNLYLGREVRDVGKPGLSDVSEVAGILRELQEDLDHGISKRTIAGRTYVLYMAVLRSKEFTPEEKKEAIEMINDFRIKQGWKPYKPKKPLK